MRAHGGDGGPEGDGLAATLNSREADIAADVHLTDAVPRKDSRIETARFQAAVRKAEDGLCERDPFRDVKEADVPRGTEVVRGLFVYSLKNAGSKEEQLKAMFVSQGHNEKAKCFVVLSVATVPRRSKRLLVALAAVLGWRKFADVCTQGYLQSQDAFDHVVYMRLRPAEADLFRLGEDELLLLLLPLHIMCDTGDYWHETYKAHVDGGLGMRPLVSDPALIVKRDNLGGLIGTLGAFVEYCCMGGKKQFDQFAELTLRLFEARRREFDHVDFVGINITTIPAQPTHFTLGQATYVDHFTVRADGSFEAVSSVQGRLAWLGHILPDLACGINNL